MHGWYLHFQVTSEISSEVQFSLYWPFTFLVYIFLEISEFFLKNLFILCISALSACTTLCQKRASDPIEDSEEPLCGFLELNSGHLEEKPVLLTDDPSLQP